MQSNMLACPNCGTPLDAEVIQIIDAGQDPRAKALLLSGQLNVFRCPNCNMQINAAAPLLYHDAEKQLLINFMPPNAAISRDESERIFGSLMRTLTASLPNTAMKAYMFQPRQALTMQGLIEQVLEADGISREVLDAQKERSRLVQLFLQTDEESLPALVSQHDEKLDEMFFQMMSVIAQQMAQQGRQDAAMQVLAVQDRLADLSTVGKQLKQQGLRREQVIAEIAGRLQASPTRPTAAELSQMALEFGDDEDKLQALAGLVRPLLDYAFFQELTQQIEALPEDQRAEYEAAREKLADYVAMIDEQSRAVLQDAADFLRELLSSDDPAALIQENLPLIDDTFMSVLSANIQDAQQRQNTQAMTRLQQLYNLILQTLQANMSPEMQFVNALMGAEDDAIAWQMIAENAPKFGSELLLIFDELIASVGGSGSGDVQERLQALRQMVEQHLQS